MKTKRAILLGIAIWVIGILFYSLSFYTPILENAETQANLVLFIIVMPLVWLGCSYYYKKDNKTHGYKVGQTMLLTAVALDALITVPFFVIPNGGNHYTFFTSLGFWIIAFEFLAVAVLYWYTRVYPHKTPSKK
ncbi:DUF5367 domain-containing protein [Maribacter sp. HTCC2170]|uniref:DUF5367 domain-containing protein n=1 Tax=Maribacter sp. (strain HTCC2170 / KCCM 42371) TaxID=313603 RepID=UPI00006B2162|nr:DUF5367 domain-containing protein [Maribacter sp. HTCC2170]EAR00059.1 hypothetical protein FB2170_00295 [Maribacter sp. HTCC2170]